MENKKNIVLSNLAWRFAERCGAQLVTFIVSIVLARILDPSTYGTIALVTIFTTILQVCVDSGLGNALIQKKNADDLDFSSVFYANIFLCTILYIIIFLFAPYIAYFFNNSELVLIIRILSITVLISGIKNVQQAYVSRNLLFKKFFYSTLIGTIVAAIVGITMAYMGYGVWALVAQQLTNLSIDTLVLWITVKWRPKKIFSIKRLKELFSYGWKLLMSSTLDVLYNNISQLAIGKLYSSSDLAFFNRGKQFPELIVNNINNSIDSVLLPTMSQEQDNKENVKNMTRKSIMVSTFVMSPLMFGLMIVSKNLIKIILTEKWIAAAPYLCVFCLSYLLYPIHTANLNAIKALGRSDLFLKLELIKKIIGGILLLITLKISVWAISFSLIISGVLSQIINSLPNQKLINYSYKEQLKDILPSFLAACLMGLILLPLNYTNIPIVLVLLIQLFLGAIIYISISYFLKNEALFYLIKLLKKSK